MAKNCSPAALYFEYYAALAEHLSTLRGNHWWNFVRIMSDIVFLSPMLALLLSPFVMSVVNAKSRQERWCFVLMLMALNLLIVPAYVMACDYMRWSIAYYLCLVCATLVLVYVGDRTFLCQLRRVFAFVWRYRLLCFLLALFICRLQLTYGPYGLLISDYISDFFGITYDAGFYLPEPYLSQIAQ